MPDITVISHKIRRMEDVIINMREDNLNILVYEFDIFPCRDIIKTLKEQGHYVDVFNLKFKSHVGDSFFEGELINKLRDSSFDYVFSVNYITVIAKVCHECKTNYVSWCCDAPLLSMYHPSISYPENHIYMFDKTEALRFNKRGINTVRHLPLAASPKHEYFENDRFLYDISFVGNLYDKNRYDEMARILPDYLVGYMDAAIEAQQNIQGGNILTRMLTDEIMSALEPYICLEKDEESQTEIKLHFATSVLSYKVAALNRCNALNSLSRHFNNIAASDNTDQIFTENNNHSNNNSEKKLHLFTTSDTSNLKGVCIHPAVDYHTEAYKVFAMSKINLNFTAPNIESGIPLRVFDILSAGGFLLTDYREELFEFFEPGKDLVIFENIEDLTQKASYYLTHEKERLKIALNGFQTLCKHHTYKHRLTKIFNP